MTNLIEKIKDELEFGPWVPLFLIVGMLYIALPTKGGSEGSASSSKEHKLPIHMDFPCGFFISNMQR